MSLELFHTSRSVGNVNPLVTTSYLSSTGRKGKTVNFHYDVDTIDSNYVFPNTTSMRSMCLFRNLLSHQIKYRLTTETKILGTIE